ncbi:MAG: hypothetical protein ACT4N8_01560 [Sphingosinicella sp.]|uniref:hypothetical protein n=1 Tax=Sphingosinicella sp. TaxID=1917971 RepID=UPI00403766EE
MRDEMFGRMWVAHHDDFSSDVARGLAGLRDAFFRLPVWDGTTSQLIALVAAFLVTGLSFSATA